MTGKTEYKRTHQFSPVIANVVLLHDRNTFGTPNMTRGKQKQKQKQQDHGATGLPQAESQN